MPVETFFKIPTSYIVIKKDYHHKHIKVLAQS